MRPIRVWFPNFITEAHRHPGEGDVLVAELAQLGVYCQRDLSGDCDFAFIGSTWESGPAMEKLQDYPNVKVIQYVWDLYPFQLEDWPDGVRAAPDLWQPYLDALPQAFEIWVPSRCTVNRVVEFVGRDAHVIKTSVRPFEEPIVDGDYVLDCMRKYPDPNRYATNRACAALGIKLITTLNDTPWERYKQLVAGCRFIVSAQWEASTGGLSALEAHWFGKPVLLSDSPRHGGVDYFGKRASYFKWDSYQSLEREIQSMWKHAARYHNVAECRDWITENYSEAAMAKRMADRFRFLLEERT